MPRSPVISHPSFQVCNVYAPALIHGSLLNEPIKRNSTKAISDPKTPIETEGGTASCVSERTRTHVKQCAAVRTSRAHGAHVGHLARVRTQLRQQLLSCLQAESTQATLHVLLHVLVLAEVPVVRGDDAAGARLHARNEPGGTNQAGTQGGRQVRLKVRQLWRYERGATHRAGAGAVGDQVGAAGGVQSV